MWRHIPLVKRLWPSLRKAWLGAFCPSGFLLRRYQGVWLLCDYRNWVEKQIVAFGDYERAQIRYFYAQVAKIRPDIFWDVGANFGLYSLMMAARAGAGEIHAFEPDPRNLAALWGNIRLNKALNKIHVISSAVSQHSGKTSFRQEQSTTTGQSKIDPLGNLEVATLALDDVYAFQGRRLAVKMDIEGHELQALQGMQNILKNNQCFLQVESLPDQAGSVGRWLTAQGYQNIHKVDQDYYWANFPL